MISAAERKALILALSKSKLSPGEMKLLHLKEGKAKKKGKVNPGRRKRLKSDAPKKGSAAAFEWAHKMALARADKRRRDIKSGKIQSLGPEYSNPNVHFPRTNRGRPKVTRKYNLGLYGAGDSWLGRKSVSTNKADAHAMAKGLIGSKYAGKIVQKVILTGP